ncbi:hypothetical protein GmHk_06G017107 [Glycine max]|nr:hypothetical protein GmHk_06G017107 [Glycine max]
MTTQMQRLLNHNNEEFYGRIEGLGNDGPRQNRIKGLNIIEGVKFNVPPFKGKSDLNAYLDWEMKIEYVFSCNDYTKEQKVKLAAAEFSDYALVWKNKNQREKMREEGREIDTWTKMKGVMKKRYVPTSYSRTMLQKLQRSTSMPLLEMICPKTIPCSTMK